MQQNDKLQQLINKWHNSRQYIILKPNKENELIPSAAAWKSPWNFNDVYSEENISMIVDENYIVLDVDDKQHTGVAKKFLEIVLAYGWLCNILETDSGYHFWFKSHEPLKNKINVLLPIGIHTDIKSYGKNSMVTIKKYGKWRKWIQLVENVDFLPIELMPFNSDYKIKKYENIPSPYLLLEGGRRDNLFKRVNILRQEGFNEKQIFLMFQHINKYLFSAPILESEIKSTLTEYEQINNITQAQKDIHTSRGKKDYDKIATILIQKFNIVNYSGNLYFYEGNIYQSDQLELAKKIRLFFIQSQTEGTVQYNINEVIYAIKGNINLQQKTPNKNYLTLLNGLLNLETLTLENFSSNYFTINKLNITYDINASEQIAYKFIDDVTQNNEELKNVIAEFWGYALTPFVSSGYGKALILYGATASNGKSTLISVMNNFFGKENCSSLSLDKLNDKFGTARLLNKMVNLASEIRVGTFTNVETLKNLITGDSIEVERKGEQPFTLYPNTKLIFATNEMPQITERNEAIYRRFLIVPFKNKFTKKNRDDHILEKLITPQSLSTFLNYAINGLRRLRLNKAFTKSHLIKKEIEDYKVRNSSVLSFINQYDPSNSGINFNGVKLTTIYKHFRDFCVNDGFGMLKKNKFEEEFYKFYSDKIEFTREKTITRRYNEDEGNSIEITDYIFKVVE